MDADSLLRSAIERQFITIGEALRHFVRIAPELSNSIRECHRIVNFRNVLVHGYARVVSSTVWGVVEKGVPALLEDVERLLGS